MKSIYIFLTALLCAASIQAQDATYIPLVREGVRWVYLFNDITSNGEVDEGRGEFAYFMEFRGDTTVNDIGYKKLYCTLSRQFDERTTRPVALMREQERHVYAMVLEDAKFPYGYSETFSEIPILYVVDRGVETELYDFNDFPAFIENFVTNGGQWPLNNNIQELVPQPTTAIVDGNVVPAWLWDYWMPARVITSVGGDSGDLLDIGPLDYPTCYCPVKYGLIQQETTDGRVLYKGPHYYGPHTPSSNELDITTVNYLINVILGKSMLISLGSLDYNGDFVVDIDDVAILINAMLGSTE